MHPILVTERSQGRLQSGRDCFHVPVASHDFAVAVACKLQVLDDYRNNTIASMPR